jgi:hypothetical protein
MRTPTLFVFLPLVTACSFIIQSGDGPPAVDGGLSVDQRSADARGTGSDARADSQALADATADALLSRDMRTSDAAPNIDGATDSFLPQDASLGDVSIPDAAPPPCSMDSDCGDARRCLDGECEERLCEGCRNNEVCLQGCCQPLPSDDTLAECTHPVTMTLGERLSDIDSDFVWNNRWSPSCARVNSGEAFGRFVPEVTDSYCMRLVGETTNAALFLRLNCCAEDGSELACDAATALDQRAQIERVLNVGVDYRLGVDSRNQNISMLITRGPCTCESQDDCDTVHVCTEGQCVDRRGQPCDDGAPCGRRSVCTAPPDPVCAEDV